MQARDVAGGFGREFDYLARAFSLDAGSDMRSSACVICWTRIRLVKLELRMAGAEKLGGPARTALRWARCEFRDRAVAARVAADAALGAAQALAGHVGSVAGVTEAAGSLPEQLQLFAAVG